MKEKVLLIICLSLMLTGCGASDDITNDLLEQSILDSAGISNNQTYQDYLTMEEEGSLNEEGEYNLLESEEYQLDEEEEQKSIHVTIASNSFMSIDYFTDASLSEKIENTSSFYLDPGEKIYCSQPVSENNHSNTYTFQEFRIYEFSTGGEKGNLLATTGEDSLVYEIPTDFEGTELAIYPVGQYEKRGLNFNAYYIDENGNEKTVPGAWYVNNELVTNDVVNISPSESYMVVFDYDSEAYYYVSADPNPFTAETEGEVQFKKATALDSNDTYSVQLHKLITANFKFESSEKKSFASVNLNGEEISLDNESIKKLKAGDTLVIETADDYRIFCSEITLNDPEEIEGGYRYTIKIPETNESEINFKVCKSELKVTLDSSVGYDTSFDIIAAGVSSKNNYYKKQTLNADYVIYEGTIGVEETVEIFARNSTELETGKAIKVAYERVDGNGEKSSAIDYIDTMGESVAIGLYNGSGEIANLNKVYKSITVDISLVDVEEYSAQDIKNASIKVKLVDTNEKLKSGDIAEGNRKVKVTITPDEGYYVSGKNVKNYVYSDTMKMADLVSDLESIIEKHPIKQLYAVTLDSNDSLGTCVFKLNGEEVTGTISVREEDELKLEYTITDKSYVIAREGSGINNWRKNTFSKTKETVTITISKDLNNKTIKRSDYINVKKGE